MSMGANLSGLGPWIGGGLLALAVLAAGIFLWLRWRAARRFALAWQFYDHARRNVGVGDGGQAECRPKLSEVHVNACLDLTRRGETPAQCALAARAAELGAWLKLRRGALGEATALAAEARRHTQVGQSLPDADLVPSENEGFPTASELDLLHAHILAARGAFSAAQRVCPDADLSYWTDPCTEQGNPLASLPDDDTIIRNTADMMRWMNNVISMYSNASTETEHSQRVGCFAELRFTMQHQEGENAAQSIRATINQAVAHTDAEQWETALALLVEAEAALQVADRLGHPDTWVTRCEQLVALLGAQRRAEAIDRLNVWENILARDLADGAEEPRPFGDIPLRDVLAALRRRATAPTSI